MFSEEREQDLRGNMLLSRTSMYTDYLCDKKNGELCTYEGLVDLKCHVLISTTLYLQLFIVHLMHMAKGNFSVSQYEYWFGACCLTVNV